MNRLNDLLRLIVWLVVVVPAVAVFVLINCIMYCVFWVTGKAWDWLNA